MDNLDEQKNRSNNTKQYDYDYESDQLIKKENIQANSGENQIVENGSDNKGQHENIEGIIVENGKDDQELEVNLNLNYFSGSADFL